MCVTIRSVFHRDAYEKHRERRRGRSGVSRISMVILERNKAFRPFLLGARNGIFYIVARHGSILHNAETHRRKLLERDAARIKTKDRFLGKKINAYGDVGIHAALYALFP